MNFGTPSLFLKSKPPYSNNSNCIWGEISFSERIFNSSLSVASIFEWQKMLAHQSPAFLSDKKCPHISRQHFWVLKNARASVASISECQKMPAHQSPAFLSAKKMPAGPRRAFPSAKKCQRDSGEHFWGQKNASGTPASIFQSPPSRETTFLTVFTPVPHRERTFSVCEVVSRFGRPPFWPFLPPSHIGSGPFQSARSCPDSGDHLFDRFYPRPTSGADFFSLRGRVPSRETTFLFIGRNIAKPYVRPLVQSITSLKTLSDINNCKITKKSWK